jgi:hypothetical protein
LKRDIFLPSLSETTKNQDAMQRNAKRSLHRKDSVHAVEHKKRLGACVHNEKAV